MLPCPLWSAGRAAGSACSGSQLRVLTPPLTQTIGKQFGSTSSRACQACLCLPSGPKPHVQLASLPPHQTVTPAACRPVITGPLPRQTLSAQCPGSRAQHRPEQPHDFDKKPATVNGVYSCLQAVCPPHWKPAVLVCCMSPLKQLMWLLLLFLTALAPLAAGVTPRQQCSPPRRTAPTWCPSSSLQISSQSQTSMLTMTCSTGSGSTAAWCTTTDSPS